MSPGEHGQGGKSGARGRTRGGEPWGVLTFREDKRTRQSYTDPAQTPL